MASSKTKKWRYTYFGYIVRDEWFLEYGLLNGLRPDMTGKDPEEWDEVGSIMSAAIVGVLGKAQISLSSQIGSVLSRDGRPLTCIVLGTNDPLDRLPPPPPQRWAKLKEILGTSKEPKWYLALV